MKMQKSAFALGLVFAGLLLAGGAEAAEGRVTIQNNTSAQLNRTGSFGTNWSPLPGSPVLSGSLSSQGVISFPNGGVTVNDVTYRDLGSTRGCNWRAQTQINSGICSVVLTPQPVGTSGGTQATCTATLNSVNSTTCDFNATFRASGF